jgi:hypothetical protein
MERSFNIIETNNNGVFPISALESILKEIEVNSLLISLIISHIKTKTQKVFVMNNYSHSLILRTLRNLYQA